MAAPPKTDPPHWFWRGVQSAIFYYVSCSPCLDAKHKWQRRKEAKLAQQEIVTQQPGLIQQPRAFQTNPQWTEEVLLGPGPPKGWKPHELLRDAHKKLKRSVDKDSAEEPEPSEPNPGRPSYERRISSALENVKGTLRSSLHPEKWNWKRYDREDEFLGGFQNTMRGMWDKVTATVSHGDDPSSSLGLKKLRTAESERVDYSRGHIPAVNDLHPPVVSQLPVTREEVAWMILPPPSAQVMAGKKPPGEEIGPRKPLCIIGRPQSRRQHDRTDTTVDDSSVHERSSIEIWDAESVDDPETAPSTPSQPRAEPRKRDMHMFDTLSDTEIMKTRPPIQPRPHSWQFHYVIPSPPPPVHTS